MPVVPPDRNLLFGLLALQMGLVGRDALLAAIKVWGQDKSKSIEQILVEHKALSAGTQALVAALVQKHLEAHENDVAKSLASLSSLGSIRDDLVSLGDADLRATVDHIPRERPGEAVTPIHGAGVSTSKGTRFRIVRPHAKGGLGIVFVARDQELQRDVALKEIQERHADNQESRTRFMLEAEITGGLEHPGIVPVYGLGQYADGRPFYAMRFIRGDSLRDAIEKYHASQPRLDQSSVAFRELLERLIDVCNAIQYAHDRGVLHRDLKPGNIMLGKYGETLVVDWGLAKTIGESAGPGGNVEEPVLRPASASGSAATMMGSAIGTPQFMSPEQASGQIDQLGPASDIYSLGATLYCLLTGQAPFEHRAADGQRRLSVEQILAKVKAGEFTRPRAIKPEIDPALEAICLKAMALKKEDRYLAPRDLTQDLKSWLADEPVNAYSDPWTVTARRWIGKNRTLVTGCAAALLVGLVSLVTATALLAQKNDELSRANTLITKQNQEIKEEAEEKEKQRKLAESRLRQSLAAVGLFANDARKYCEDALVPGDSRRRLYEVLIKQLEEQAEQAPGEATIDRLRNKALMYRTLCSVHLDFYDVAKSKEAFDKGIQTVDQWEKLRPADPEASAYRAGLLHLRAQALAAFKKNADAKQLHREALAIRRKVAGDVDRDLIAKADAVAAVADSLDGLELFDESLELRAKICKQFELVEKKIAKKEDLRAAREQSYPYREAWCWTYQKAGLHATDYPTRKKYLSVADAMSETLMRERRTNRALRLRWADVVKMLGELEYNFGKLAEKEGKKKQAEQHFADAAAYYEKLNQVSRGLATSDELVHGIRDYSRSFYTLALAEQRKGNAEAARKLYERSHAIRNEVFLDHQNSAISIHLQIDLFFSQIALGQIDQAINMIENLFVIFRDEPDVSYRTACLCALAMVAIEDNRKPDPLTATDKRMQMRLRETAIRCLQFAHDGGFSDFFQTSIDSDFDAIRDDPRMTEFEAAHQYRLGLLENKRGDAKKAKSHFEQARTLANTWLKGAKEPRQVLIRIDRMCIDMQLGQSAEVLQEADRLYGNLEKNRAALFRLARVYAIAAAAERDVPKQSQYRDQALTALEGAGDFATQFRLAAQEEFDVLRDDARFKQILQKARK